MSASEAETTRTADRVYGAVAGVALVLALVFAVQWARAWGDADPPALTLLGPATGDTVRGSLTVTFDAGVPLAAGPGGMGFEGLHLHLAVDTLSYMAGPADLRPLGGTRYAWTTSLPPAGDRRVRLYWSDELHRPLRTGSSRGVDVHLAGTGAPAASAHDAHAGHAPPP